MIDVLSDLVGNSGFYLTFREEKGRLKKPDLVRTYPEDVKVLVESGTLFRIRK
jgi:hypothetical protein